MYDENERKSPTNISSASSNITVSSLQAPAWWSRHKFGPVTSLEMPNWIPCDREEYRNQPIEQKKRNATLTGGMCFNFLKRQGFLEQHQAQITYRQRSGFRRGIRAPFVTSFCEHIHINTWPSKACSLNPFQPRSEDGTFLFGEH